MWKKGTRGKNRIRLAPPGLGAAARQVQVSSAGVRRGESVGRAHFGSGRVRSAMCRRCACDTRGQTSEMGRNAGAELGLEGRAAGGCAAYSLTEVEAARLSPGLERGTQGAKPERKPRMEPRGQQRTLDGQEETRPESRGPKGAPPPTLICGSRIPRPPITECDWVWRRGLKIGDSGLLGWD